MKVRHTIAGLLFVLQGLVTGCSHFAPLPADEVPIGQPRPWGEAQFYGGACHYPDGSTRPVTDSIRCS